MQLGFQTLVKLSYDSIWSNRTRTIITISIIALGIMALVGINIVISSMKGSILNSFSSLGANTLMIDAEEEVKIGRGQRMSQVKRPISQEQYTYFKENYNLPASISVYYNSKGSLKAQLGEVTTDPKLRIIATDDNYLEAKEIKIQYGRNLSAEDLRSGSNVCLLGSGAAGQLFENPKKAIDTIILLDGNPYKVAAVLESKGSSMGNSQDNSIIVSILNSKRNYPEVSPVYNILVKNTSNQPMSMARDEAISTMRQARQLRPAQENDFNVQTNEDLTKQMNENLNYVSIAAIFIGIITLLSASVSLMNIMLVSVTERTKEVGLQKAIGATSSNIRNQFLMESVLISMIGGVIGIMIGVFIGFILSVFLSTPFIIPWGWIGLGIAVTLVVGLVAGIYPAQIASRLQPIEALRYE